MDVVFVGAGLDSPPSPLTPQQRAKEEKQSYNDMRQKLAQELTTLECEIDEKR